MFKFYFVLALLCISNVKSWDIAVTAGDQLELYSNGTKIDKKDTRLTDLTALAYDAVHNILLFVDKHSDNASIFSYHLGKKKFQPLVRRKVSDNIQGLTFDPLSGYLFWTDSTDRSIMWTSLFSNSNSSAYGNLLLKTDKEIPRAVAVDSCRGYIYWTNIYTQNATIERMRFDGTERKVIVYEDIFMPTSIAVDQREKRIYWSDNRQGIHYSIESIDLDGKNRQTVLRAVDHLPNALTVSKDFIYWTDWGYKSVWKYPKHPNPWDLEPIMVTTYDGINPYGIVANYNIEDQIHGIPECENLEKLSRNESAINDSFKEVTRNEGLFCLHGHKVEDKLICECLPGYTGERCEISVCQNYCLKGDCSVTIDGKPTCNCGVGYKGVRCESNTCMDYCLNNGQCTLDLPSNAPVCKCTSDYDGSRCETLKSSQVHKSSSDACNCTKNTDNMVNSGQLESSSGVFVDIDRCSDWDTLRDPLIMVLATMSGTLSVVCAVLVFKIMQLKKRPRIKKRIIVNKNVTPLTARPDQCEITIENCCNMNICETPCFEPRTIRPNLCDAKPGKEEKENLIANMEHQDDLY